MSEANHRCTAKTCKACGNTFLAPGKAYVCRPCVNVRYERRQKAYRTRNAARLAKKQREKYHRNKKTKDVSAKLSVSALHSTT